MEKSAQTSLDSQEGSSTLLPIAEQEICSDCKTAAAGSTAGGQTDASAAKIQKEESLEEKQSCLCAPAGQIPKYGIAYDFVGDLPQVRAWSTVLFSGVSTETLTTCHSSLVPSVKYRWTGRNRRSAR